MTIKHPPLLLLMVIALCCAAAGDRAARLVGELTPLGALRAGNADGSIPAWDGGLNPARAPAGFAAGRRYADPFADEKPRGTITRANISTWEAKLTPGQRALFEALPDDFSLPVYATHRTATAPAAYLAGTLRNAGQALLGEDGSVQNAGAGLPFPVLESSGSEHAQEAGLQAFWNQRLRWRGPGRERVYTQATVSPAGETTPVRFHERAKFFAFDAPPVDGKKVLAMNMLAVLEPPRLSGTLKLVHERLTPPSAAWQRSPGPDLPLLQRTSEAGDDTTALAADGLLLEDQREGYVGGPERYRWRLIGRREIIVPYNAYRLHAAGIPVAELLGARHLNPALARYELHRVWVLDAKLKPNLTGAWPRRTFYIDEDSWQILLVELYGRDERIERVQEIHTQMAWDQALLLPVLETVYDLPGRRYLVTGIDNLEPESTFPVEPASEFTPERAKRWARRIGAAPERVPAGFRTR